MNAFARKRQCKACPWKVSTNPHTDIPGGYGPEKHQGLIACQASFGGCMMACHESIAGAEYACVGWLLNQVGPGHNHGLRMRAIRGDFDPGALVVEGEQHASVEAMCATVDRRIS